MEAALTVSNPADSLVAVLPTVGLTVGLGLAFYAVIVWLGERADRREMDRIIDAEARLVDNFVPALISRRVIYRGPDWRSRELFITSEEAGRES
jgi:hypothetical protein